VTPRAEVRDGSLDVVIVGDVSRLDFLSLLPDLRKGTHLENPDVLYFRASTIDVDASGSLPVNVDGEPMRARSFRYRLLDRPLTIMTP
jgi:diacylglycerol kinase (ATP)